MSENKGGKNMPRKPTVKTDNLEENVSAKVKNTSKKSSARKFDSFKNLN